MLRLTICSNFPDEMVELCEASSAQPTWAKRNFLRGSLAATSAALVAHYAHRAVPPGDSADERPSEQPPHYSS